MTSVPLVPQPPEPLTTTAAKDFVEGLKQWELWGRLGWLEIKRRYRRTVIGPFWSVISIAVVVLVLGGLGAGLLSQPVGEYLPFLAAGMVVWTPSTIISPSARRVRSMAVVRSLPQMTSLPIRLS